MIDQAAAERADLVVLPEFCNHLSWYDDRDHARRMACRPGDAFLTAIAERAARGTGSTSRSTSRSPTTTAADRRARTCSSTRTATLAGHERQADPDGQRERPPDTAAPRTARSMDHRLRTVGMYACMEGVITEVARGLALRGAEVLLNSLNSFATDEASLHIPVRAAENQVWVVAANKVGPLLPGRQARRHQRRAQGAAGVAARRRGEPDRGAGRAPSWRRVRAPARRSWSPTSTRRCARDKRRPDGTDRFTARRGPVYAPIGRPPQDPARPQDAEKLSSGRATTAPYRPDRRRAGRAGRRRDACLVLPELQDPLPSSTRLRELLRGTDGGRGDQRPGGRCAHRPRRLRRRHRRPAAAAAPRCPARRPGPPPRRRAAHRSTCRGGGSRWWSATTPSIRRCSASPRSPAPTWSRCRSPRPRPGSWSWGCRSGPRRTGSTSSPPRPSTTGRLLRAQPRLHAVDRLGGPVHGPDQPPPGDRRSRRAPPVATAILAPAQAATSSSRAAPTCSTGGPGNSSAR